MGETACRRRLASSLGSGVGGSPLGPSVACLNASALASRTAWCAGAAGYYIDGRPSCSRRILRHLLLHLARIGDTLLGGARSHRRPLGAWLCAR
eukprot:scaffold4591_cov35-Phaeocystis_antarctica.AAC.1